MKNVFIAAALVLSASIANAGSYSCKLTNGDPNDSKAVSYSFDTAKEDNKFVDMGQGIAVGCVVLRAKPQLITCGVGNGANFSIYSTTEDGASILGLQTNSNGTKSDLTCVKNP